MYQVLTHVPFFDEVNAWNIAAYLKPSEIFEITRHEGHLFIWYFILKPFAQNDLWYPYSMQIINWLFAFGAILLLWYYSPFNTITKMFITFSLPLKVFYIHARCYSIGIFLLFLLCVLYKNRLKHPICYSILLVLIANTSIMAGILAFSLGLCFIYDLAKAKSEKIITNKDISLSVGICLVGAVGVISQLYNFVIPYYSVESVSHAKNFYSFYLGTGTNIVNIIFAICHLGLLAFSWNFFEKNKLPFIYLLLSNLILMIMFFEVYRSTVWHFVFLFITLIIALWMYLAEYSISDKFQKSYMNIFCLMFVFLTFFPGDYVSSGPHIPFLKYIQNNIETFDGKKMFFFPTEARVVGIVPELSKTNISFYDCYGNSLKSKDFYIHQWDKPEIDFEKISNLLNVGEIAYVVIDSFHPERDFNFYFDTYAKIYLQKHCDLNIKYLGFDNNVYMWQITKIVDNEVKT